MSKFERSLSYSRKDKYKISKLRHGAFVIHVNVEPTNEKFTVKDVNSNMTVTQLKDELEFATGIPISLQRLSYLDEGE